ncbi:pyruvate,orthophosphate dikinase [Artemisia annua]|uniref:Pyruvate,orthophosphate dikinase n=1 Tax=Artemisia annua TaxID=35608 RepID=A0A2U1P7K0_ARTAN|nr:pyruvate,orthophosphate dikinase [Artemisia annua]
MKNFLIQTSRLVKVIEVLLYKFHQNLFFDSWEPLYRAKRDAGACNTAIFQAAVFMRHQGMNVFPEIMVPLVGTPQELRHQIGVIRGVATKVFTEMGLSLEYKVGTMIEIPRVALTADEYYPADFTKQERFQLRYELEMFNISRLIRLILTLLVSTTTTEREFSAMKICKNRLRNRMSDKFLADSLVVHIKKDIAELFDSTSIIDEFKNLKGRRADL